jgi:hypothetical protein
MLAKPVRFCLDTKLFKLSIFGLYLLNRSIQKTLDQLFFRPFRKKKHHHDINNSLANAAAPDPT